MAVSALGTIATATGVGPAVISLDVDDDIAKDIAEERMFYATM